MGLLKKLVFLAMVKCLPLEETEGLCCLFRALDCPCQGFLTAAKLQVCKDLDLCSHPNDLAIKLTTVIVVVTGVLGAVYNIVTVKVVDLERLCLQNCGRP